PRPGGDAKTHEPGFASLRLDKDVGRLQIHVNNVPVVELAECGCDSDAYAQGLSQFQRSSEKTIEGHTPPGPSKTRVVRPCLRSNATGRAAQPKSSSPLSEYSCSSRLRLHREGGSVTDSTKRK